VVLLVDDAARGSHPLDVARSDHAAVAGRVAVLDLPVVNDRDRLEASVRVLADSATLACRLEQMRPGIVEQQERADVGAQVVVRKERANGKAVADPMLPVVPVPADDLGHVHSPIPTRRRAAACGIVDYGGTTK
jgi:hypothetical protein